MSLQFDPSETYVSPLEAEEEHLEPEEQLEETTVHSKKSHHVNWWHVFWIAVVVVVVVFVAIWVYDWYRKSKLQQMGQTLSQNLQNQWAQAGLLPSGGGTPTGTLVPTLPLGLGGGLAAGIPTIVPNPHHVLMTPQAGTPIASAVPGGGASSSTGNGLSSLNPFNALFGVGSSGSGSSAAPPTPIPSSPISAITPGTTFHNNINENRVHFFYNGATNENAQDLYKEFSRLRKRCQRKDFGRRYGYVGFRKCDISKPEGRHFYRQLVIDGLSNPKAPLVTFGRSGGYSENLLGGREASTKQMLENLVEQLQAAKKSSVAVPPATPPPS